MSDNQNTETWLPKSEEQLAAVLDEWLVRYLRSPEDYAEMPETAEGEPSYGERCAAEMAKIGRELFDQN